MTTGHDELGTLVAAYVLDSLDEGDRQEFEAHLASCALCTAEVRSLSPVVDGLARAVPAGGPSPALRGRVLEALFASSSRTRPGAPATVSQLSSGGASERQTMTLGWLALAAMLLLTIGMGAYVARLRALVSDLESRLDQALRQAAIAETAVADAHRVSVDNLSAMAVLAAPDLARIDLKGQTAAPRASARALWSRDLGMVFTATRLPALPPGKVYQVWVVTAGAAISAGLLVPDAEGRGVAVFRTSPGIPAPVAVAVTVEPEGGVPAPTGDKYLVGLVA